MSQYFSIAVESLVRHRLRTALTMLGIVVGVLTVMLTIGLGAGARASVANQIASLGSNLIVVNSGPPPSPQQQATPLSPADAQALREACPLLSDVAPQQETRLPVSAGTAQLSSNFIMGVTAAYASARRMSLAAGRFLDSDDDARAAKVVVMGSSVRTYLFGGSDPIGRRVLINGVDFDVIGILDQKGDSPGLGPGMSTDDRLFVPLTALQRRLLGTTDLRVIAMTVDNQADTVAAVDQIRRTLNNRHPHNPFEIKTQLDLMQASSSISGIVTLLLTSLAGVSLVVGGIGIMNILLVSVSERTREIGIRRAVGARARHIVMQFLAEAVVLGALGGATGVLLGLLLSWLAGRVLAWPVPIVPQAIAVALGAASLVGVTAGWYPARRASRLDVVEALRSE